MESFSTKASVTIGEEKQERELVISFDFGSSVEEAVEKYGAEAVYANYLAHARQAAQGYIRGLASALDEDGVTFSNSDEDIQSKVSSEWVPTDRKRRGQSPEEKLKKLQEASGLDEKAWKALLISMAGSEVE